MNVSMNVFKKDEETTYQIASTPPDSRGVRCGDTNSPSCHGTSGFGDNCPFVVTIIGGVSPRHTADR